MIDHIENDFLKVEIDRLGGELKSIKNSTGIEYLWQGNEQYWKGRAYNLFPVVGRMINKQYVYKGKKYTLDIHGFVKNTVLKLKQKDNNHITYYLEANDETKNNYPFDFCYELDYLLEGNKIIITYNVKNKGENQMYFGIGGHPGFNVPIDNGNFEDYYLEFDNVMNPQQMIFNSNGFKTNEEKNMELQKGKIINLSHKMFEIDGIYLKNADKYVTLKSDKSIHSVKVSYPDMKYIAFWTKGNIKAPYICIEPWQSLPDKNSDESLDIEKKDDMIKLEKNKEYNIGFTIEIK